MCIGIYKPGNKSLPKFVLLNCFDNNPHGAGYAYIEDGQVFIRKGFFEFEEFWESFNAVQTVNKNPMLIHFRVATFGVVNKFNCHPWGINERYAMIHNGTIEKFSYWQANVSDTGHFTHNVLKPMFEQSEGLHKEKFAQILIEQAIGTGKIAILGADGEVTIYNEKNGHWVAGVWFSNTSFYPDYHSKKKKANLKKKESKKEKPTIVVQRRIRRCGEGNPVLTMKEISDLCHEHKGKIVDLVYKGVVEYFVPDAAFAMNAPACGSAEYQKWWQERFKKVKDEASETGVVLEHIPVCQKT